MAKKAVLIGINRYRIPGADLRGCVPDVKNMSKVLQRNYGFDAGDICMLTDFAATKGAIQEAITGLVSGGRRGDVLVLHYFGHGSNVPDDNSDEADNRDEILCPTDLDWYDTLRDDWLRGVFDSLKDGVSLTMISDSCHSGTFTRAVEPPDAPVIERYLPSPWDIGRWNRNEVCAVQREEPCTSPWCHSAECTTSSPSTTPCAIPSTQPPSVTSPVCPPRTRTTTDRGCT